MAILQRTGVTGSLSISSSRIPRSTSASLFSVNGYNGRLINVVDSLSGSLFSVNSIAGLPIFEVFSNNRIVAGKYNANDFVISGSRVGIGTNNPTQKLHITTTTSGNDGLTIATTSATGNPQIRFLNSSAVEKAAITYASGTDAVYFYTAASGGNILNFVGANVGIGTTSPDGKLSVIQSNTYSSFRSNGVGAYTFLSVGRTSSEFEVGVSGGTNQFFTGTTAGDAVLKSITGKLHLGYGSTAPAITIDTSNNVGIGAVNPASRLHISSSTTTSLRIETKVNSAADSEIEFVGPDTHSYAMGIDESDSDKFKISYAASRTPPTLGTNDRFVIQTDGKIGIGTSVAETDLSVVDMNFGRVTISGNTYYGVWLTGGTSATDFSFLSSPSDTNLYLNAPSTKAIYNQINNVNRFIISADNVRINNSAAGADGEEFQRWSYISTDNYYLKLIQTVTAGVVRYNFSMVNNATAYNNVLVLDRGNVGVGSTTPAYKLDVTGTAAISGDVGLGGVPDAAARLYVQGEALTEPFLSVQTCLGNNSTNSSFYTSFKGWLAVKIGNNVGTAGNLLTTGTYYIRLWG